MNVFTKEIEVRWADLDPNFHMLHSKYYDLGAYCRMAFLVENGITPALMKEYNFGPIIFREECIFRKEILFADKVTIDMRLEKMSGNCSRWSMVHEIRKNDNILAAIIKIDGAWIDTTIRKLTTPPEIVVKIFDEAPKTPDFFLEVKEKAKR